MIALEADLIELVPLTTERVTDAYVGWLNDPATNRFMGCARFTSTADSVIEFVESFSGRTDRFIFAILARVDGAHIGNIALQDIDATDSRGEVGVVIGDPAWRGRGAGTQAIGLMARFAFLELGLHRLTAGVVAGNEGSRRAFEKAGFTVEGVLREHYVVADEYRDVYRLGMLASEYDGG